MKQQELSDRQRTRLGGNYEFGKSIESIDDRLYNTDSEEEESNSQVSGRSTKEKYIHKQKWHPSQGLEGVKKYKEKVKDLENQLGELRQEVAEYKIFPLRDSKYFTILRFIKHFLGNRSIGHIIIIIQIVLLLNVFFYKVAYRVYDQPYGHIKRIINVPFTVYVGEYISLDEAKDVAKELKKVGFNSTVFLKGNKKFMLCVGFFRDENDAVFRAKEIMKKTDYNKVRVAKRF